MDQSAKFPSHSPKVDALITDITQLMNEAEQMLADSTSQHAEAQVELVRSHYEQDSVRTHFTAFCTSAGRAITDGARRADRTIRENPYQALAMALGVGLLLGMACKNRRA